MQRQGSVSDMRTQADVGGQADAGHEPRDGAASEAAQGEAAGCVLALPEGILSC